MDRITLVDSGACSRDMFVLVKSLETARTTEEEGRVVRVQAKLWTKSLRGGHLSTRRIAQTLLMVLYAETAAPQAIDKQLAKAASWAALGLMGTSSSSRTTTTVVSKVRSRLLARTQPNSKAVGVMSLLRLLPRLDSEDRENIVLLSSNTVVNDLESMIEPDTLLALNYCIGCLNDPLARAIAPTLEPLLMNQSSVIRSKTLILARRLFQVYPNGITPGIVEKALTMVTVHDFGVIKSALGLLLAAVPKDDPKVRLELGEMAHNVLSILESGALYAIEPSWIQMNALAFIHSLVVDSRGDLELAHVMRLAIDRIIQSHLKHGRDLTHGLPAAVIRQCFDALLLVPSHEAHKYLTLLRGHLPNTRSDEASAVFLTLLLSLLRVTKGELGSGMSQQESYTEFRTLCYHQDPTIRILSVGILAQLGMNMSTLSDEVKDRMPSLVANRDLAALRAAIHLYWQCVCQSVEAKPSPSFSDSLLFKRLVDIAPFLLDDEETDLCIMALQDELEQRELAEHYLESYLQWWGTPIGGSTKAIDSDAIVLVSSALMCTFSSRWTRAQVENLMGPQTKFDESRWLVVSPRAALAHLLAVLASIFRCREFQADERGRLEELSESLFDLTSAKIPTESIEKLRTHWQAYLATSHPDTNILRTQRVVTLEDVYEMLNSAIDDEHGSSHSDLSNEQDDSSDGRSESTSISQVSSFQLASPLKSSMQTLSSPSHQ